MSKYPVKKIVLEIEVPDFEKMNEKEELDCVIDYAIEGFQVAKESVDKLANTPIDKLVSDMYRRVYVGEYVKKRNEEMEECTK